MVRHCANWGFVEVSRAWEKLTPFLGRREGRRHHVVPMIAQAGRTATGRSHHPSCFSLSDYSPNSLYGVVFAVCRLSMLLLSGMVIEDRIISPADRQESRLPSTSLLLSPKDSRLLVLTGSNSTPKTVCYLERAVERGLVPSTARP